MKSFKRYIFIVLFLILRAGYAQDIHFGKKDSIVKSSWMLGLGVNIVDDSATPFGRDFFSTKETWNAVPYPSRLSVGRFWDNGMGVTAIATYNKYRIGKKIDGDINTVARDYYALDVLGSYDLNNILGPTGIFDPYVQTGLGYSAIGGEGRVTANGGFGFRVWLGDRLGVDLNTMGKWGLQQSATRQLQHSASIVYQLSIEKGLSKKGLKKQELFNELIKERSEREALAAARKADEEAKELARRIMEEAKEKQRLADAGAEAKKEALRRRQALQDKINEIGNVHFDLNSSYLGANSKSKLDKLAELITNSPTLVLKVASHTDARGTDTYNIWLSQRRVKRTVGYLISKGVRAGQLTSEAFGEKSLLNDCTDGVYCPEEKHRENRRSGFSIEKL